MPVSLSDFKSRAMLITAVYSTCTTTCPMMLTKIRTAHVELNPEQRKDVVVVALSLNPQVDTRELRAVTAKVPAFSMDGWYLWRLVLTDRLGGGALWATFLAAGNGVR